MIDAIGYVFGLIFFLVTVIYKFLSWHFNVFKKLGLPGPKPKLIYGNFPSVLTGKQHLVYDIDDVYSEYKRKHRAIGVFMTRSPEILILDPKLAHDVMVTNFSKYRDNLASQWVRDPKSEQIVAGNPFFINGDLWKAKRTDVMGGLTTNKLNLAYPIWKGSAEKLRKFLQEKTQKPSDAIIETKDLAYRFTVDLMSDFLWGIDSGAFTKSNENNAILQSSQKMLLHSFEAVSLYYVLKLMPWLGRFFNTRFYPKDTDNFFTQLTHQAVEMRLKDASNKNRADFLNYVMQLQEKKQLSHIDVVGNGLTVLLDGYETAATVLCHTLYYLAKYTEVQEKLRSEILANLEEDKFLSFEHLNSLPYLDQCVHETIRIITLIPTFSRICSEATEMEIDDNKRIPIKVGTVVTIPNFSFNHDSDYFPQPFEYNPERFDNGKLAEIIKQGIFMPFGNGPRICVGMRTGLFEVKTGLVEVLKSYRVICCSKTLEEKKPDSQSFILGLGGDIWLEYEKL